MHSSWKRTWSYGAKRRVIAIVFFFLWRAFKALYQADSRVRAEIDSWPDELTLHMQVSRSGPDLYLRKTAGGLERLKVCAAADVEIQFKCLDEAFQLVTGQLGVARAYAEHRFTLAGDIGYTMSFVRCVNLTETYLFPRFMTKRILLAVPKKEHSSLAIYRRVIFGV